MSATAKPSKEEKAQRVIDALSRFPTDGVSEVNLAGQGDAFEWCLELFNSLEKAKRFNRNYGSYGLKHLVEDPSGRFGVFRTTQSAYRGYVFEGTLVLAAKTLGFLASGPGLHVAFNFSGASMKAYLYSVSVSLRDKLLRSKLEGPDTPGGDITKGIAFDGSQYYARGIGDGIVELTRGGVFKRLRFAGISRHGRGGQVSPAEHALYKIQNENRIPPITN